MLGGRQALPLVGAAALGRPYLFRIRGRLAEPGHHLVLAEVIVGEMPQWQVFKVYVTDPRHEAERQPSTPREAPRSAAGNVSILTTQYNGDIRAIFRQRYLSPRPKRAPCDWEPTAIRPGRSPMERSNRRRSILAAFAQVGRRPGTNPDAAKRSLYAVWRQTRTSPLPRYGTIGPAGDGSRASGSRGGMAAGLRFHVSRADADRQRGRAAPICGRPVETLNWVPPLNFWSLCPWGGIDYSLRDRRFLPAKTARRPPCAWGTTAAPWCFPGSCAGAQRLEDVTLETLSQDVVIGLMGVSLMNP